MPLQAATAIAAALVSFAADGDRIRFTLDRGSAEFTWIDDGTFRYRRTLEGLLPESRPPKHDPVAIQIKDTPDRVLISSRLIEVSIAKKLLLVSVRALTGDTLMQDAAGPQVVPAGIEWSRVSPPGSFYGLGPRTAPELDLRGRDIDTSQPFLISSAGYGEYHSGGGTFHFDLRAAKTYRIVAPRIDYYFYYGPRIKAIFEHHHAVRPPSTEWKANDAASGTWDGLRNSLLRLVHAAMSGELDPSFDLVPFRDAPVDLAARARQIGSLVPKVVTGRAGLSGFRQQLDTFFTAYLPDTEFHGYPMWHALPFQFPNDPECGRHADEFMLGDEMLIAPIYDAAGKRSVYLPQGTWTNLETNEAIPGRRTIAVETKALPVFARNGTIVPLDSEAGIALHYFPTLPAEFFLLEQDIGEYSQVHAAPAGDEMRLEIESAKPRGYEWVLHHVDKPSWVGFADRQFRRADSPNPMADGTWFYDTAQRNLYIRLGVKAGEDSIVNLRF